MCSVILEADEQQFQNIMLTIVGQILEKMLKMFVSNFLVRNHQIHLYSLML